MASAFAATRWVLMGTIGFRLLAYVGQVAILRLVTKDVFGSYRGLVDAILMMLPVLTLSMDSLLIQQKPRRLRYGVALSQCLAAIGVMAAAVPIIACLVPSPGTGSMAQHLVKEGGSWHAVLLMAPIFAVMATKLSIRSLLSAELNFRRISIGEFGNGMFTYFGGVAAVLVSPTAGALMLAYLAGEIFECVWMYRGHKFRPLTVLEPRRWRIVRTLYLRHRSFLLTNTADFTINNLGSLLPGMMFLTLLSAQDNADFQVSRMLIQLPILLLVGSIWRVAYPTIAGAAEPVLQERCLRIVGTAAAFIAPGVFWLAFFAPTTVALLGGKDYASAAPLVQWMATYMLLTAIYSPISTLDMIRDRSDLGLYWNIVHTASRVAVIWWCAPKGLLFTVAAMSLTSFVLWIVWAGMLGWLLRCGWRRFVAAPAKFIPLWVTLCATYAVCVWLAGSRPHLAPIYSIVPGLAYLAIVMKFFPAEADMVWRLMGKKSRHAAA